MSRSMNQHASLVSASVPMSSNGGGTMEPAVVLAVDETLKASDGLNARLRSQSAAGVITKIRASANARHQSRPGASPSQTTCCGCSKPRSELRCKICVFTDIGFYAKVSELRRAREKRDGESQTVADYFHKDLSNVVETGEVEARNRRLRALIESRRREVGQLSEALNAVKSETAKTLRRQNNFEESLKLQTQAMTSKKGALLQKQRSIETIRAILWQRRDRLALFLLSTFPIKKMAKSTVRIQSTTSIALRELEEVLLEAGDPTTGHRHSRSPSVIGPGRDADFEYQLCSGTARWTGEESCMELRDQLPRGVLSLPGKTRTQYAGFAILAQMVSSLATALDVHLPVSVGAWELSSTNEWHSSLLESDLLALCWSVVLLCAARGVQPVAEIHLLDPFHNLMLLRQHIQQRPDVHTSWTPSIELRAQFEGVLGELDFRQRSPRPSEWDTLDDAP